MFRNDIFDAVNRVFANVDGLFRDAEKELGMGNLFPHVTVPSVKTYYSEQRAIDDGEKITYFTNGKVSRVDGPAVVYHDKNKGQNEWWIDGRQVTKEAVEAAKQKIEDERVHHVSVDGRTFEVKGSELKKIKELLK